MKLKYWLDKGLLNGRGETLLDIPTGLFIINNDVTNIDFSHPIGETNMSLSQDTLQMLKDDKYFAARKEISSIQLTQETQQISVNSIMQSNVSTDEVAISTVRNTLKKLEPNMRLVYQDSLEELDNKMVKEQTNNTDDNNQYSKLYNRINPGISQSLCSPMTGVNTKKRKKEKMSVVICKVIIKLC